ncbi:MAG: M20/M25/M40 family metallo-hydrolase [Bacilli bacterium]|nr:M20/M25/M40 family metallo-hydrolase [Bacilli bacterium]
MWDEILIGLGIALAILIIVIIVRTLLFFDKTDYNKNVPFDKKDDNIVYKLGQMLKVPTISYEDKNLIDYKVFHEYIELVQKLYPTVFKHCEYELSKELVIKLKLKGESSDNPTVLMSHYDVVPVTDGWDHDPFLGEVVDGYLYGRGALDTKCTMACALSALEKALEQGYTPKNDLYLCFGGNEEVYGDGQWEMVQWFAKEGIKPALVFDEGGGIMNNAFPGVKKDSAFLAVVEKSMVNVKLSINTTGGHSSTPKRNGPVIRMAKALVRLEKHHMKPQISVTTKEMLDIMGRNSSFALKIIFANMWLFKGLVKKLFPIISADTNALLTSTFAFTVINGGNQTNVIPNHVEANINVRVAPFNSAEEVIEHIKKVIKDPLIEVTAHDVTKLYKECSTKQAGYGIIKETTMETYPNTIVSPFVMLGGTDAKHYNEICDCVIRFSPIKVSNEDRKGIHGLNEKISVETLEKCLEFYQRLLTKI